MCSGPQVLDESSGTIKTVDFSTREYTPGTEATFQLQVMSL
jgi:hypothetical protein